MQGTTNLCENKCQPEKRMYFIIRALKYKEGSGEAQPQGRNPSGVFSEGLTDDGHFRNEIILSEGQTQ